MHTDDLHFCSLSVNVRFTGCSLLMSNRTSTPARKAEVHRMMSSQTGEGQADKGAELVPPAERTKTHTGRPEQRISPAGSWFRPSARERAN